MLKKDIPQNIAAEPKQEILKFFRGIDPKKLLVIVLVILAVLGLYGTWHFYAKYQALKANPNLEIQKETERLTSFVGKLMELPKNETPTIATVSDKEKLKNQSFFNIAENGDKVLVYNTAMIAILYRPSTNKIVNVAPINNTGNQTQTLPAPMPLRIAYYNGTDISGLAKLTEKAVKNKYSSSQTILLTDASKKDYKKTIVIDISTKHSKEASDLATLINGQVGPMPASEIKPDTDILIISGK